MTIHKSSNTDIMKNHPSFSERIFIISIYENKDSWKVIQFL